MNLDDESLLSAYLDNELDPADRLAVEWSIETNPPLAEQYRSLLQARAAVSRLPRPGIPRDLAADLGARLLANRRRDRLRKLARPARVALAFSGFAAIAASMIFALILLNHSLHDSPRPDLIAQQPELELRPHLSAPHSIPADPVAGPEITSKESLVVVKPETAKPGFIDDARERDVRLAASRMLEQPHVRRIRIVTDVLDAPETVKHLITQDSRLNPEFLRISICQEIVIDPEFPEPAEVFAVPMDERDRKAFVGQLAKAFPGLVEEVEEARPELVTQLTEVGQVALFRGTEAAPLVDPPHDLHPFIAKQAVTPEHHIVEAGPSPKPAIPDRKPDSPRPLVANNPDVKPSTGPKVEERVTVLVWVIRPTRHL